MHHLILLIQVHAELARERGHYWLLHERTAYELRIALVNCPEL